MSTAPSAAETTALLMRHTVLAIGKGIDRRLQSFGLTLPQLRSLMLLAESDHLTPTDVAGQLGIDTAAASRLLDRLEAKRFCDRVRQEGDRRMVSLVITDRGREALELARGTFAAALIDAFADVPHEDMLRVQNMLRRIRIQ